MVDYFRNLVTYRRRDDERGASAVEYGLLVAGIAAVIVTLVFILGGKISNAFDDTCKKIASGDGTTTVATCSNS